MRNFARFLNNAKGRGQFPSVLDEAIDMPGFPGTKEPDNLFAVSQFFMKNGTGRPEDLLEALVVAYHRWLAESAHELGLFCERSIAANRVVFTEDGDKTDTFEWKILNRALLDLAGSIQDFEIASNHQLLHESHEESK